MINKLRDIVTKLKELDDAGKAETIETGLKVAKEDATRKLKDKQDLYEDGENIIKLGKHKFGVNKQILDLTIVYKDQTLKYHLTGTDFYQEIENEILINSRNYWDQELISENKTIYRAAYLAYKTFTNQPENLENHTEEKLLELVKAESSKNYTEGYVKGVHDEDASKILKLLITKNHDLGLLRYKPAVRAYGQFFWQSLNKEQKALWNQKVKASGEVLSAFSDSKEYKKVISELSTLLALSVFQPIFEVFSNQFTTIEFETAAYLFHELQSNDTFCISQTAQELNDAFLKELKSKKVITKFNKSIETTTEANETYFGTIQLALQWSASYLQVNAPQKIEYAFEMVCLQLFKDKSNFEVIHVNPNYKIENLKGSHTTLSEGTFEFKYHDFISELKNFTTVEVPAFTAYRTAKHSVTEELKEALKLGEFKPRVLSSFVRNKLIDKVYLPLFGDNLSKQLGSVGDNKRTDRMGMLLLISPPGYGKTTLMGIYGKSFRFGIYEDKRSCYWTRSYLCRSYDSKQLCYQGRTEKAKPCF